MSVQVIRDQDATCEVGEFLRVYCQQKRGSAATFATIERVFGGAIRTQTWFFRTLVDCAPMDAEVATQLAAAYAERKNIPVVYVEVEDLRRTPA